MTSYIPSIKKNVYWGFNVCRTDMTFCAVNTMKWMTESLPSRSSPSNLHGKRFTQCIHTVTEKKISSVKQANIMGIRERAKHTQPVRMPWKALRKSSQLISLCWSNRAGAGTHLFPALLTPSSPSVRLRLRSKWLSSLKIPWWALRTCGNNNQLH